MTSDQQLRHALKVTSAWLAALAHEFNLDERTARAVIKLNSELVVELSIGEALDLANAALEEAEVTP